MFSSTLLTVLSMVAVSSAVFPPTPDSQDIPSNFSEKISVSFKDASGVCETTPNVKSYAGYVSMSSSLDQIGGLPGYPINTFWWFFESRKDPSSAPFVLWHGGGPGFPGTASATFENGPCNIGNDSNSTTLNEFSWTNEANILYIDSPSMVGYSYDMLTNATIDGLNVTLPIIPTNFTDGKFPAPNNTLQVGTFGSQNPLNTANSTGNSSPLVWAALQAWFSQFPQYTPQSGAVHLWGESYAGRFVPGIAGYINLQNAAIAAGSLQAMPLRVETIGLINPYIDPLAHVKSYPAFVNNNTYGLQTVSQAVQASMQQNLTKTNGCLDLITNCQQLVAEFDPSNTAANATLNGICAEAFLFCEADMQKAYDATSGRSQDDIAHPSADPFPPEFFVGWFNQAHVQKSLGAAVNYTSNSAASLANFVATGDLARQGALSELGQLLDQGTSLTLIYGDRDYQVNWLGGEQVSLAMNYSGSNAFRTAGYANFTSSDGSFAGLTRQAGNFSFTRVFQAGHSVPAYQPRAALDIFARALNASSIATGGGAGGGVGGGVGSGVGGVFATQGPQTCFDVKNTPPQMPLPLCYTWEIGLTCPAAQMKALADGSALVEDFVVLDPPVTAQDANPAGAAASGAAANATAAATNTNTTATTATAMTAGVGRVRGSGVAVVGAVAVVVGLLVML